MTDTPSPPSRSGNGPRLALGEPAGPDTPHELLFRLLAGELGAEEAAALRSRLVVDPELSAAWVDVLRTEAALVALEPVAPPAHLAAPATTRPAIRRVALAFAATAALAALTLVVVRGVPRDPRPAVPHSEEDPMHWKTATLSAAAGAAVTVAVYEGRAAVSVGDREPVVVSAGESVSIPARAPTGAPTRAPAVSGSPDRTPPAGSEGERVASLELENAMLRGQLALLGGARAEWPAEAPPELRQEALEPWVREAVGKVEGVSLERLDCEEFPCIAVMTYDPNRDASTSELNGVRDGFADRLEGANSHVWLFGDEHASLFAMSFGVDGLVDDPAVATRLDTRVNEIHEQIKAESSPD